MFTSCHGKPAAKVDGDGDGDGDDDEDGVDDGNGIIGLGTNHRTFSCGQTPRTE